MLTTLVIEDDVLIAAKEMAAIKKKIVGEVISALARQALFPADPRSRLEMAYRSSKCVKGQPE